jgi:predicted amino acid racemase
MRSQSYQLVHVDSAGVNAFFIGREVIVEQLAKSGISGLSETDLDEIMPQFLQIYQRHDAIHPPRDLVRFRKEILDDKVWETILPDGTLQSGK